MRRDPSEFYFLNPKSLFPQGTAKIKKTLFPSRVFLHKLVKSHLKNKKKKETSILSSTKQSEFEIITTLYEKVIDNTYDLQRLNNARESIFMKKFLREESIKKALPHHRNTQIYPDSNSPRNFFKKISLRECVSDRTPRDRLAGFNKNIGSDSPNKRSGFGFKKWQIHPFSQQDSPPASNTAKNDKNIDLGKPAESLKDIPCENFGDEINDRRSKDEVNLLENGMDNADRTNNNEIGEFNCKGTEKNLEIMEFNNVLSSHNFGKGRLEFQNSENGNYESGNIENLDSINQDGNLELVESISTKSEIKGRAMKGVDHRSLVRKELEGIGSNISFLSRKDNGTLQNFVTINNVKNEDMDCFSSCNNEERHARKESDNESLLQDIPTSVSREKISEEKEDSKENNNLFQTTFKKRQTSFPFLPIPELDSREDTGEENIKDLHDGNDFLLEDKQILPNPIIRSPKTPKNIDDHHSEKNSKQNFPIDFAQKSTKNLNDQYHNQKKLEENIEEIREMFIEMKEKYLKVCMENKALKEKIKDMENNNGK